MTPNDRAPKLGRKPKDLAYWEDQCDKIEARMFRAESRLSKLQDLRDKCAERISRLKEGAT